MDPSSGGAGRNCATPRNESSRIPRKKCVHLGARNGIWTAERWRNRCCHRRQVVSVGTPTWIPHGSDSIHSIAIAMTQDEVLVTNKRRFSGFDQVCQLPVALSLTQFSKASSELTIGFQPPVGSVSPFPIAQKAFPNYPFVDGDGDMRCCILLELDPGHVVADKRSAQSGSGGTV